MRLRPFALSVVACGLAAIGAEAACVTNATDAPLFFTIDARSGGARVAAPVAPGAQLCLSETWARCCGSSRRSRNSKAAPASSGGTAGMR